MANQGNGKLSRRGFISHTSAAAGAAAATGLSGCAPAEQAVAKPGGIWERPPDQRAKGNRQNLIFLNVDTFRADNLAAYGGNGLVKSPRLDKFSEDCVVFEDCYPEGLPTIPIRRVLMTGRRIVPYHYFHQHEPVQTPGWHELYYEDQTISETLNEAGYHTALIADIPHMQRPGKNFHRGYKYYEWSRGHEVDYYEQASHDEPDIVPTHYPQEYWDKWLEVDPGRPAFMKQYLANRSRYENECEAVIELTAKNVMGWLRRNHDKEPFFCTSKRSIPTSLGTRQNVSSTSTCPMRQVLLTGSLRIPTLTLRPRRLNACAPTMPVRRCASTTG